MTLAYCLGQRTTERTQKLHLMSSTLGLEHAYIWLDCHQDLVEALQLARPDLIVAFATELNQCTNDLESFLLTYAPETSPIIVYTTDDKSLYQFNKNRRVLALNENWNAKQIKAYMIVKASR
jgi:hypothetical protein